MNQDHLYKKKSGIGSPEEIESNILDLIGEYIDKYVQNQKRILGKDRIPYSRAIFNHKEIQAIVSTLLTGWFGAANNVKEFEHRIADFHGVKYGLMVNSGSSANLIAVSTLCAKQMRKERLKPGDEVLTPATTFPTTFNPILQNQLVPVVIDTNLETLNINTEQMQNAISKRTRAIIIPHTLGNPNNMSDIMDLVQDYNLFLIEDSCDALGSLYDNKKVGTFGDIATFSFYPAHHITTGEGGGLITNNPKISRIAQSIRDWGRDCWCSTNEENPLGACGKRFSWEVDGILYDHKYIYSTIGYNLKPLELQGAMGLVQIDKLDGFTRKRKENHKILADLLHKIDNKKILITKPLKKADPNWFAFPFTILEDNSNTTIELIKFLEKNLITTRRMFAGNILRHPAYINMDNKLRTIGDLSNADKVFSSSLFVGVYPGLTKSELKYIGTKILEFFEEKP